MIKVNLNEDKEYQLDLIGRSYHKLLVQRDGLEIEVKIRVDRQMKIIEVVNGNEDFEQAIESLRNIHEQKIAALKKII
jgi:hypothetical protein